MPKDHFKKALDDLVRRLRSNGYIKSDEMERAFRSVPREEFVRPDTRNHAYRDSPANWTRSDYICTTYVRDNV